MAEGRELTVNLLDGCLQIDLCLLQDRFDLLCKKEVHMTLLSVHVFSRNLLSVTYANVEMGSKWSNTAECNMSTKTKEGKSRDRQLLKGQVQG